MKENTSKYFKMSWLRTVKMLMEVNDKWKKKEQWKFQAVNGCWL